MGFSAEWEKQYQKNQQMSIWPWSDLISYVMRYTKINASYKVLEIGCGAGANIPFFMSAGCEYYAIEGSKTVVENLHEKYPEYKDTIIVGDFTKTIDFEQNFDLIIDRASLTHNKTSDIKKTLENLYSKLKSNGKYIGIDWFSVRNSNYKFGDYIEDSYTKNAKEGYFAEMGNVHFSDKEHLQELFKEFKIEVLEEKVVTRVIPDENILATWNVVAAK